MSFVRLTILAALALTGCQQWNNFPPAPKPGPVTGAFADFFPGAYTPQEQKHPSAGSLENKPTIKVALLLPLSGESEALGEAMVEAASLALYDAYLPLAADEVAATVTLYPYDTTASPTTAAQVASHAMEQGATVLIGPLYSQSVKTVGEAAAPRGVPVIALSNNRQVAASGVFIFGYTPEQQVEQVLEYALSNELRTYALLAPNDAFGKTVTAAVQSNLGAKGGKLVIEERYGRTDGGRRAAAERLAGLIKKAPVDAVFIADSPEASALMAGTLQAAGLDMTRIQLIGTGQWEQPIQPFPPALNGAMFAATSAEAYAQFDQRFMAAYGRKPERLSSLTYDAVALVAALAREGKPVNAATLIALGNIHGLASGAYRLHDSGIVERSYGVMALTPNGPRIIAPARRLF